MQFLNFVTFFTVVALSAMLHAGEQAFGFDTNDVSILFALQDGKLYPVINLAESISSKALLTQQILDDVLLFEHPNLTPEQLPYIDRAAIIQLARWNVTSLRFDPCGDHFKISEDSLTTSGPAVFELSRANSECQNRLRVVVQPTNGFGQPFTSALHLIYKLNSEQTKAVIEKLKSIKYASEQISASTNGIPLSVHPGVERENQTAEGTSKPIGLLINELLTTSVSVANLEIVTMILAVKTRHWKLAAGFIRQGRWHRTVTSLNKNFHDSSLNLGVEEISCNFYEICNAKPQNPNFDALILTKIFQPGRVLKPDIERENPETTTLAEKIDSPQFNFFSTNCLSCHESSNYRNKKQLMTEQSFWPVGITPFTFKHFVSSSPSSVINFGYDGNSARVSTRTASESAIAADRTNIKLNLKNPGFKPKSFNNFWSCLMAGNQNCLEH